MDQNEIMANFLAITGLDEAGALGLLEACSWNLEEAAQLHWGMQGDAPRPDAAAGMGAGPSASPGPPLFDEEEVRAPLPAKVDRLYAEGQGMTRPGQGAGRFVPAMAGMGGLAGMARGPGASDAYGQPPPRRAPPPVDIFKDVKADSLTKPTQGNGAPLAPSLSDMFKRPIDLIYTGDLTAAAPEAAAQDKWMMINVQSNSEFASHQLNRDTWAHEAVKQAIGGMFLFIQIQDGTPDGRQACETYRLEQLPVILVLDPLTGGKLYERTGFVGPEKLLEDLVPFMDHGPKDPGAADLGRQTLRRKAPAGHGSGAGPSSSAAPAPKVPLTEDQELAMAIAMSMEGGGSRQKVAMSTGGGDDNDSNGEGLEDEEEEEDVSEAIDLSGAAEEETAQRQPTPQPRTSPEQVQQEAAARLPPEPAASDSASCSVAVRLPSGERKQRRFASSDSLQALRDLVLTLSSEAAQGRPFSLGLAGPGAAPLTDMQQSLQDAGAKNALVTVTWDPAPWP